jgi:cytosine/adenosine deaminase-related metal-dependent hydrolase
VVTLDDERRIGRWDVLTDGGGRIAALAPPGPPLPGEVTVDARGMLVLPGLVQAHVHLCQTLFRGLAEDRPLLRWLRERIWPLEAAHDAASLAASARLGIAELLLGGTTAILDMGTVQHTDALFGAAEASGLRYTGGKAMMDGGAGVPAGLRETRAASLAESERLAGRWHGSAAGRLRYAYCPRFVLSCSTPLLRAVAERAAAAGLVVHTHASEQLDEAAAVRRQLGRPNITALASLGLAGPNACLAHCVWPEPEELEVLAGGGASVLHCPSSNLKLGSGIAPIHAYLARGINVALGADGAPGNNRLDGWEEVRLAGLLSKVQAGVAAVPARAILEMATRGGARALGLETEIGSVEVGKQADLTVIDLRGAHAAGFDDEGPEDVYTRLVYGARASDVRTVLVGGAVVVRDGRLLSLDLDEILHTAREQRARLLARTALR